MKNLIQDLQVLQNEIIELVQAQTEQEYQQQYHPDLSPVGWHLGHCTYTESYWIREQLLDIPNEDAVLKSHYVPELNPKSARASVLPEKNKLLEWGKKTQTNNRSLLETISNKKFNHPLLENNFLLFFLIQHYSQHLETIQMILTEKQIQNSKQKFQSTETLEPTDIDKDVVEIKAGEFELGSNESWLTYDNEHIAHTVVINDFKIARTPVTNSEYLMFMTKGGYTNRTYWSATGWQWLNENKISHPHHWYLYEDQYWTGINSKGINDLEPDKPVHGLNYFEASAFANWAGARLPHEYEWEVACNKNVLKKINHVWEWCNNTFHPYPGFTPYPYAGYSTPYFDDKHFVLRGGSVYTKKYIKRPSFRNYYQADKRHIFAGLRLVYN